MQRNNKKILIVTPGFFPLFGGMEEQCYILAKEFIRTGHKVDLLTEQTEQSFLPSEDIEGIRVFRLGHVRKRNLLGLTKLIVGMISFLLISRNNYNFCIVRTFTLHALVIGILKTFRLLRYKTWVTADTGGDHDDIITLKRRKFSKLILYFLKFHDYFNSICDDNFAHFQELNFPEEKLTRIYNGINADQYALSCNPTKVSSFLFLGRLSKTKGIRELLKAFNDIAKKYPDKKLFIGGYGDEKSFVEDYIVKNNLEGKLIYLGYVTKEQRNNFYERGECLILPSYSEGFPISILEASIRRKVIIATDVSDLKRLYGNNIIFCKKSDAGDLEKKMEMVLNEKPGFNYDRIVRMVDVKNIVRKLTKLI